MEGIDPGITRRSLLIGLWIKYLSVTSFPSPLLKPTTAFFDMTQECSSGVSPRLSSDDGCGAYVCRFLDCVVCNTWGVSLLSNICALLGKSASCWDCETVMRSGTFCSVYHDKLRVVPTSSYNMVFVPANTSAGKRVPVAMLSCKWGSVFSVVIFFGIRGCFFGVYY